MMSLLEPPAKAPDAGGSFFTSSSALRTGQAGGAGKKRQNKGRASCPHVLGHRNCHRLLASLETPQGYLGPWSYTSPGPPRAGPQVEPPTPPT